VLLNKLLQFYYDKKYIKDHARTAEKPMRSDLDIEKEDSDPYYSKQKGRRLNFFERNRFSNYE